MSVFESVIGLIAPPTCIVCSEEGSSLCDSCASSEVVAYGERCFSCGSVSPGGRVCESCRDSAPRHVWISTTYEGIAADLIKLYKFGHQRAASDSLAKLMVDTFFDFNSVEEIKKLDYQIVPIPTATKRARQRGFDHAALLAKKLATELDLKFVPALGRLGQTRQLGSVRSERIRQPADQYYVRYPNIVEKRNLLLIDDVTTTGATIKSVTKELRAAGAARIDALIFAKRL